MWCGLQWTGMLGNGRCGNGWRGFGGSLRKREGYVVRGWIQTMRVKHKTPRPCAHPGCAALVVEGQYCDKHKRDSVQSFRNCGKERRLYDSVRWRMLRLDQLMCEPFCRLCASHGLRVQATDVDHIIPHRGDPTLFYNRSNLQSLCHSCHSRKTRSGL